jgi:hypothetical protein
LKALEKEENVAINEKEGNVEIHLKEKEGNVEIHLKEPKNIDTKNEDLARSVGTGLD